MLDQLRATRKISGSSVKVCGFGPIGAAQTIRVCGPESLGGLGNIAAKVDAIVKRTGKTSEEAGDMVRSVSLSPKWINKSMKSCP